MKGPRAASRFATMASIAIAKISVIYFRNSHIILPRLGSHVGKFGEVFSSFAPRGSRETDECPAANPSRTGILPVPGRPTPRTTGRRSKRRGRMNQPIQPVLRVFGERYGQTTFCKKGFPGMILHKNRFICAV
jgi:hypothetical protein